MDLTPRERVRRLFRREPIDTMPVFSGFSTLALAALQEEGLAFSSVHTDAGRMARAALQSTRLLDLDGIAVPFDLTMAAEAMGCTVNFYEGAEEIAFPTVSQKIWRSLEEIRVPEDMEQRGRIPLVPQAVAMIRQEAPDYPVGVWLRGPFTQLGQVLELETVLKAVFKSRDAVAEALDRLTEMTLRIGLSWQAAGVDFITLSEPGASADVLPPRLFHQLVEPRLTRILAAWESPKVLHISGKSDPLVEFMAECGADALAVDNKNTLQETRAKIGDRLLLFGNFDVYDLPCNPFTSPEEAAAAVREIIDAGVDAVWPGSDLWPDVRLENMRAIVDTVREYGRKPSPVVGRR